MVCYLHQCGDTFGPPNTGSKPCPVPNLLGRPEAPTTNNKFLSKTDITKVSTCCPPWNLKYREKSVWSRGGTLYIHAIHRLFCLTYSFTPDTRFLGNVIHQALVDDVHMVKTCSKVQAFQEATKEVSKPYACQLLDNVPDTEPQHLGDATPLRGVNVAIPMERMKDHYQELCYIIVKFLSTANNLDIHLVNRIGSSYSECTYADIFVNKLKV
ncbi:hypothetical protein DSO57_1003825 [Entomophthora muscae]|uniref:Uncharacterized protein n=1 Tax=Entomophthora muscae TaxID=34485 RepID=A0ACC2UU50_9FUNG|nr:hypothetical protein DSO57_1003825 [Entomophthora muscae]